MTAQPPRREDRSHAEPRARRLRLSMASMARTGLERPRLRGAEGGVEPARTLPGLTLEDQQASLLESCRCRLVARPARRRSDARVATVSGSLFPSGNAGNDMAGSRALTACVAIGLAAISGGSGRAVTFETMDGAPVQMQPYVPEPGAPTVTIPAGTAQPLNQSPNGGNAGGSVTPAGGSDALTTMFSTSWGATAAENAQSLGLNASALASVCVAETTSCNSSASNGSFIGAFQMGPAAFHDGLNAALSVNPALSSQVVPGSSGIRDPTTQAIAQMGYMIIGNTALQSAGISNPTALDYRSFQNFGPTYGVAIATAPGGTLMSGYLPASYLAPNGITPTMTVEQWRLNVSRTIGNSANQPLRV